MSLPTERPVSVLERWLAAGDRGELELFDELLHEDAVVHAPRGLSTSDRESEKQLWRDARAAMPDLRHEVQELLSDGRTQMARVVVTGTLTSTFAGIEGTGRRFRMDQAVICHLRNGKVAEAWEITDVGILDPDPAP